MDLPTYTSIWRIEKRLYKLYDFRLPMPLPIGQIAVFAAIAFPFVLLLSASGVPFNHTLVWLYVLPPAAITWLVTRPVVEGKRLPELVTSQLRYLTEPRAWCRMAPLAERDAVVVTARVWQIPARAHARPTLARPAPVPSRAPARLASAAVPAVVARPTRVTVVAVEADAAAPPAVERALAGPSARRGAARATRVSVIPGGYRPGRPDQRQRDLARAQLPIGGPARVVVLGCTVGAGQTATALMTGEVLAREREESVAALDLNPGPQSLARRALARPAVSQAASLSPSRLVVLGGEADAVGATAAAAAEQFELAATGHDLILADPSTAALPRLLPLADQLVLVAPASAAAASAVAMTFEWLEAHGQARLAAESIMVINGVSRRSMPHVEQAERVTVGRCRAIVRVPWDDRLSSRSASRPRQAAPGQQWAGLLGTATATAYTALAGVLIAALAAREQVTR